MIVCPACGHSMLGNPGFCHDCGKPLHLPTPDEDTLVVKNDALKIAPKSQKAWQSAQIRNSQTIEAHIAKAVLAITLTAEQATTLGRAAETHEKSPDVDLTDYNALEDGVSRLHAALCLEGDMVQVTDLGSTNGTFLNGQRISSSQSRIVRDKDKLRLGNLKMTLLFS